MKPLSSAPGLVFAAVAACAALVAVFATARVVRAEAAKHSHQQPTDDPWIERAATASPTLVANGRKLFLNSCAHCHGADATGDEGPDLHDVQVSDRYISTIVRRGIRGEMPSFAKKHNDADIAALIAYVRSLER